MKLFEVTRWGNDADGGNGPDTNYLVCAGDHEEAATLVRGRESRLDAITELGVCSADVDRPTVLRGPYIENKLEHGTFFTLWSWDGNWLGVWVPKPCCRNGEATCYYPNGQLAARCEWRDGSEEGVSQLWYPTGQLMHRGNYQGGGLADLHEWWFADGTLASRQESIRGRVRTQQWDQSGTLVADTVEDWGRQEPKPLHDLESQ